MAAEAEPVRLSEIGQIALTVRDVPTAVAFYRDTLGMELLFEIPEAAFFACGAVRLMLGAREGPQDDCFSSVVYYRVESIREVHVALIARGVPFEREPHLVARLDGHDLWMAFFRDPDRNLLALMSEVPRL